MFLSSLEGHLLATSNAIINCRNELMQLTFGKKLITPEKEEGLEEVCIIDTLIEEHCNQKMQEKLNECLGDLEEGLPESSNLLAALQKLKYTYLEENKKCPVVISSSLSTHQEVLSTPYQIAYGESNSVVPKKSGITVVQNEKGEEVATRLTSGWRVCIDYSKLNVVTRKDQFPLPFIDQVLERVSGHPFYCFLDGYSGYFQIEIDVEDQEKTTFTCPFGTYAYRRMLLVYAMHLQHSNDVC
ncbi:Transposon Ty3-I Gag-Pol polyprotein [Vitis vinifera]|uniref:Transposon Ty3-I Gag-Pol polyprotein n=1 Tax=Vitis vinifera TaxID=29760 RepID=A0A438GYZ4_VITVI|nr:Transposon Ty3-I Gag-Pol polyprotein [Vitis vinifera]